MNVKRNRKILGIITFIMGFPIFLFGWIILFGGKFSDVFNDWINYGEIEIRG